MTTATTYLGLKLAHPFMLGASPLTAHLDNIRRIEDGGASAIVMHSLFAEQIGHPPIGAIAELQQAMTRFRAAFAHFPPPEKFPLEPNEYLEQIRKIKAAVSVPVIGSLNGVSLDGWVRFVPLIAEAGADALELNVYYLSMDPDDAAHGVERRIESLVERVKSLTRIPVAVKLTPFYTTFASFATRLERAGADGLVLFNRFYQSEVDTETLRFVPNVHLSTSSDLLLRLHWLAALSDHFRGSLAATGGVHTALDGVKAVLSGAHAAQLVSAILQQGPRHFQTMEDGLRYWMARHEFASVDEFRGRATLARTISAAEFERTNYREVLQTWSG